MYYSKPLSCFPFLYLFDSQFQILFKTQFSITLSGTTFYECFKSHINLRVKIGIQITFQCSLSSQISCNVRNKCLTIKADLRQWRMGQNMSQEHVQSVPPDVTFSPSYLWHLQ